MLYLHLATLHKSVEQFIIGYSNQSFAATAISPMSFAPFEIEISSFANKMLLLYIDFDILPLAPSRYRNETAWNREATARNHLLEGVRSFHPDPDDLILLCDVDEICTRDAIRLVRRRPPVHYYNLQGLLFHYSFRWQVTEWERPLVIRYGALEAPLDDYKFMPFLFPLPGVLHYHCSFCFPTMAAVLRKLASFSHTEFSEGRFKDPNYVYARIACGYGVLPPMWKQPEQLTLVDVNKKRIFLPDDERFDFLVHRIGFTDLNDFQMDLDAIKRYMPKTCTVDLNSVGQIGKLF
jgi:hypothetical protein